MAPMLLSVWPSCQPSMRWVLKGMRWSVVLWRSALLIMLTVRRSWLTSES